MRHYFGYDINGQLRSLEIYGPTGWPTDQCMEDPDCADASVTSLREARAKNAPDIINWVLYNCPCDAGQGDLVKDCVCFNSKFSESVVDVPNKTLIAKPLRTVFLDDVAIENEGEVFKTPGSTVVLKIFSAAMPDGEKATCVQRGIVNMTIEDEWELSFQNGMSETKALIVPPEGIKGIVAIGGRLMRPIAFLVRGHTSV